MSTNLEKIKREIEGKNTTRKEMLQKILNKVNKIEEDIIYPAWDSTFNEIECENFGYAIRKRKSNQGVWKSLEVGKYNKKIGLTEWKKIPKKVSKIGNSGYVHGDFNTPYEYINTEELIKVAEDTQELVEKFRKKVKDEVQREEEALSNIDKALEE